MTYFHGLFSWPTFLTYFLDLLSDSVEAQVEAELSQLPYRLDDINAEDVSTAKSLI